MRTVLAMLAVVGVMGIAAPAAAQEGPRSIVSIYRAAPGQQIALLKWFARQDEIAKEAGVATSQFYAHQDGASWDYVLIAPDTTREQDAAMDAAAKKLGFAGGAMNGIELRKYIAEHTDTYAAGPTTAAAWLKRLGQ
ncbi:hypothetical protein [Phenylobacterium sp.]|uniref:hypothetical protein n=1 Tax=Phenylobacterium sp. TaxID=1871053 RepID=UPI002FC75102